MSPCKVLMSGSGAGCQLNNKYLRGSDCKYRESVDRLEKSKILITCQKNTFGELSSKILLKLPGTLLFSRNAQKTKIPVFPN